MLVSIHYGLLPLCVIQLLAECLDLLLVGGADGLQLGLDGIVELFFVSLYFRLLEVLLPGLEHVTHLLDFAHSVAMLQYQLCVLFEFSMLLECAKALHLDYLHAGQRLSLARPKRHDFSSQRVLIR